MVGLQQLPTFSITQPSEDKHKHQTDLPSSPRKTPSLTVSPCNVAPLSAITTKQNYNAITYMYTCTVFKLQISTLALCEPH